MLFRVRVVYKRILVGTDGSSTAALAVERAVSLAGSVGASVTIMTAGKGAKAETVVADAAARHASSGVAIDTRVVDDDPVNALIQAAADDGYDLLVVGNKGMTGVSRFFKVGAVPNKISHHLPTSLLVVKTT